jgi:hypothetical protein
MDEPLNTKQALEAIESIADERLRFIAHHAFMAAMSCLSMQRDTDLGYATLKHFADGGKPAEWE